VNICSLLWRQLYVSENGSFYPCCLSRGHADAEFRSESGEILKIDQPESLAQAWNSPTIVGLRKQLMQGEKPEICRSCFEPEARGDRSLRVKKNQEHLNSLGEKVSAANVPLADLRALDVRWGNLCNLKCRMCHPEFSRGLIAEHQEFFGMPIDSQKFVELRGSSWFHKGSSIKVLGELENLDMANFAGGEPLLVSESFGLLRKWVQSGQSKKISLSYNTNLTVLPEEAAELWREFREVQIHVSIDGYERSNSYIRYPSNWNKIERNLRELAENPQKYGVSYLGVHTALQIYSVFSFPRLVSWLKGIPFLHPYPDITVVTDPEYFDLRSMPLELKDLAISGLQELLPEKIHSPKDEYFRSSILAAIQFIREEGKTETWEKFLAITRYYDRKRGQNIASIPELAPYFFPVQGNDLENRESAFRFPEAT
jgi:MoaA/NifB/PqqE/SkfB family radical SAM enzyme